MFNEFELDNLGQDAFEFDDKIDSISSGYGSMDDSLPTQDIADNEGAMAKADLFKLAKYSYKLFKKINDDDQLEAWVQAKIVKAADYIASVYHYLEYEMEFSEYGKKLENSEMYTESQKRVLRNKLMEAKNKLAKVKIEQAKKSEETEKQLEQKAKSPIAKKALVKKPVVTNKKVASNKTKELEEAKSAPSAGMTKAQKSAVVKKARAGEDIGKPGKGFAKVEKAAEKGGAKDPKAVAAAAMWKTAKKKALKESMTDINADRYQQSYDEEGTYEDMNLQEANHMTYHTTILNPNLDMEDPEGQEEIDVTVEYSVFGENKPATWGYHGGEPPESPEVEIYKITDDETGEEIEVDDKTYEKIIDEILNQDNSDGEPFDYDYRYESKKISNKTLKEDNNIQYHTLTIPNPEYDSGGPDNEIEVEVEYTVTADSSFRTPSSFEPGRKVKYSGSRKFATDLPNFDILRVTNIETGEEIDADEETIDYIKQEIMDLPFNADEDERKYSYRVDYTESKELNKILKLSGLQ